MEPNKSSVLSITTASVQKTSSFLTRHKRAFMIMFAVLVVAEGTRVGWRGKYGDFKPVISVVNRMGAGEPMYVGNPTSPAYVYSPIFALTLAPLHVLPNALLRFLWYLSAWGFLVWSWLLCRRIIFGIPQNEQSPQGYGVLAVAPLWYFAYYNALNGQSTPLMIAFVLLSYHLDRRGKPLLSGLSLAGSMLIKPFPVIFLGYYLLRRRFRTCASAIAWICVFMTLPILYFREAYASTLQDWLAVNKQQQTIYDISDWGHQSVSALWYRVFGWQHPPPFVMDPSEPIFWAIWVSIALVVMATVGLTFRAQQKHVGAHVDQAAFALYMLCWAMLPPTSWKHYYILLLFPCSLLAKYALSPDVPIKLARASTALLLFIFFGTILLQIKPSCCKYLFYEMSLCLFMGLSAFATLCAAGWMKMDGPDQSTETNSSRIEKI